MKYEFHQIEEKWQKVWKENQTYKVTEDKSKPKFYVLDMFPYPSGAGLHVGHPLGYIASDIFARYKRLKGFNVLHPMGYDAFGLPAEQYAIQTGQHPADSTKKNIKRYREQLDKIGFCFDWDREVITCEPEYYHWTQWAFLKMFNCWYDNKTNKATPIESLIAEFEANGNQNIDAATDLEGTFTSDEWKSWDEAKQEETLQKFRIAFLSDTMVNWCPALGTVLANDEVKDGVSERGGHPVEQKKMKQWCLRVTAYAQRLLDSLDELGWTDSLKEMQKNWIGRSEGATVYFPIKDSNERMEIFTTRPDTIYGVTFMVLAPESELIEQVTTSDQKAAVDAYLDKAKRKTERERMQDKTISGVFTGGYCKHPFTNEDIPIWIGDYVLGSYGTGAIMAVPAHDERDWAFAKHFNIPIVEVVAGGDVQEASHDAKSGKLVNSDLINGLDVKDAIPKIIAEIDSRGLGSRKVNFRLRDAIFARQRYWGEPFPIYFKDGIPKPLDESDLPLRLPEVDAFKPTETGEPPLGRAKNWTTKDGYPIELSTMPGFAGSSAYYLRYMDPHNDKGLVSKEANEYWQDVDLYIGGTEHATGHLIYSRFWNKFLYDLGYVCKDEPFKKLVNQGMIQGRSNLVYRVKGTNQFVSLGLKDKYETSTLHVDVNIVENDILDTEAFKKWRPDFKDAEFILEDGKYVCGYANEKMSKSLFNVVNPDDVIAKYGTDTFRLYEMFLGPIQQSKPWNTSGIEGIYRFLLKVWRLYNRDDQFNVVDETATADELKSLHKCIKKVDGDIQNFDFNTAISAMMICVNELSDLKCNKREILEKFVVMLCPFAPHIAEELWSLLGHTTTVTLADFPTHDEKYLVESNWNCPVSVNGKLKFVLDLPVDYGKAEIEKAVMEDERTKALLNGKNLAKLIVVPKKIVNLVIK
ncbi:MAG: leucine--tRNA ligase [Deltaproteobacteria bacterium]|nr:MAG: leucine--tRNA ligase [Deltaproteobacteria bacterium]TNF31259.1 MAG: leucine--tRNA ligase [Deltaproteobacteria bacterium]